MDILIPNIKPIKPVDLTNFKFHYKISKSLSIKFKFMMKNEYCDALHVHSMEKCYKKRSWFLRKNQHFFRQINVFTKEVTKELTSRKFFERDRVF